MPQTAAAVRSLTIGNRSYSSTTNPAGNNVVTVGIDVPAAVAGTLTTRTSASAGVITSVAHGLTTLGFIDIYFNVSGSGAGVRRGVVITAVTTDTFTFTSTAGDALPAVNSAVTYCPKTTVDCPDLVGSNVTAVGADAGAVGGTVYFLETSLGTGATETLLVSAGVPPAVYTYDGTGTNPMASKTVVGFRASQPGTTAQTAYVSLLVNN